MRWKHLIHQIYLWKRLTKDNKRTYNLFLCVLVGTEKVDSLHVSKVDIMSQKKDKEELAHILLFTVAIQSLVTCQYISKKKRISRFVLQLLVRAHFK